MTEYCVCCGAEVPEGRMVCWACEHGFVPNKIKEEDNDG